MKAKWQQICKMPMSHGGDKTAQKMAALNLALVKEDEWEELVLDVGTTVAVEHEKKTEGKWLYRAGLNRKLGKVTASICIKQGKLQQGEDSDGESVYRKVVVSDSRKKVLNQSMGMKATAQKDPSEMTALQEQLDKFFNDSAEGDGQGHRSQRGVEGEGWHHQAPCRLASANHLGRHRASQGPRQPCRRAARKGTHQEGIGKAFGQSART